MYFLASILVLVSLVWSPENAHIAGVVGFCLLVVLIVGCMGFAWLECEKMVTRICPPSNMTMKIESRLREYFRGVSGGGLSWRVGPDFYWLEVESTAVRKVAVG